MIPIERDHAPHWLRVSHHHGDTRALLPGLRAIQPAQPGPIPLAAGFVGFRALRDGRFVGVVHRGLEEHAPALPARAAVVVAGRACEVVPRAGVAPRDAARDGGEVAYPEVDVETLTVAALGAPPCERIVEVDHEARGLRGAPSREQVGDAATERVATQVTA